MAVNFSLISRRVAGAGQSQSASSTCSSAAESGFSLSESPYTGFTSDFCFYICLISTRLYHTRHKQASSKSEEPCGKTSIFLHLS